MSIGQPSYLERFQEKVTYLEGQQLKRKLRLAQSACAPRMTIDSKEVLTFCSNDYLGLANHPLLIQALGEGASIYGSGSGASHLINGHSAAHALLESKLADWQSAYIPDPRALFFCTGYMANLAVVTSLCAFGKKTSLFSDSLNHASLIDGIRLASRQFEVDVQVYPHLDLQNLEQKLQLDSQKQDPSDVRLIITDGVFSMDGDLALLPELLALAEKYDALLLVDDAHGFGILGDDGHGILQACGLKSDRLVYIATLGKAAGISGAFIVAHQSIIEWMVQSARPYIYSTATPPSIAHTALKSLELIESSEGHGRRNHLNKLINRLKTELNSTQWELLSSPTAIQPLIIGSNEDAIEIGLGLEKHGIYVPAIRPPTVPKGTARLRITLSASHTDADLDELIHAIKILSQ